MSSIYDHPGLYDLEHSGKQPDIAFFVQLAAAHRPARVVEYACGNGRLALPLAKAAEAWGGRVTGIDTSRPMVQAARNADPDGEVTWCEADLCSWRPDHPADFIFSGCASLSLLTSQEKQIAAWRNAFESLADGGRFVVAEIMPNYQVLAEAMRSPASAAISLDGDFHDGSQRLVRCRASQYRADLQHMRVRYFYDRFSADAASRFIDDYEAHVFFPNELRLLFRLAGFQIESEWGDYHGGPLTHESRVIILCGRKG